MSVYTTYQSTLEGAYLSLINTYVVKKQVDAKDICEYTAKARIVAIFLDIFPYLADCDCITEAEFKQFQNLIIKITGETSLGIINLDDMTCGGISSSIVRSTSTGTGTTTPFLIERGNIDLTANTPYNVVFSQTLGSSADDYSFVWNAIKNGNEAIGATFTNQTANGFTVETIEDCVFTYICILL